MEFLHSDNFCQAHIKAAEACSLPDSPVVRRSYKGSLKLGLVGRNNGNVTQL